MKKTLTGLDFKIQEMAGRIRELREISGDVDTPKRADGVKMTEAERRAEIARREAQMKKAAEMLEYEYAAVLRDRRIELRGQ